MSPSEHTQPVATSTHASSSSSHQISNDQDVENDDNYSDDEPETPLSQNASPTRSRKIRFRSRVRITSGINRRRKASLKEEHLPFNSSVSDLSGSPSSSISAPLRTNAQEAVGKPGWGTLGQRVSMFARGNGPNRKRRDVRTTKIVRHSRVMNVAKNSLDERTPLLIAEAGQQDRPAEDVTSGVMCEEELAREIDAIFGSWPYRLMNHHWWWWYIQPVVCCQCLTDSDDEG